MRASRARERYTRYPRAILWLVPGGEARIGGEEPDAQPVFRVEVAPFYLSKFPVTNEQYAAFDPGFEPAPTSPEERDPAVGVSYEEALAYCAWYAGVARKPIRLPSEVEWEYACRAGAEGRFFFDHEDEAERYLWDAGNSGGRVRQLDAKKANGFGLFGMLGGVWEWTASAYRPYPLAGPEQPTARGAERVLRGGSFRSPRSEISCSCRRTEPVDAKLEDAGFRIVKSLR